MKAAAQFFMEKALSAVTPQTLQGSGSVGLASTTRYNVAPLNQKKGFPSYNRRAHINARRDITIRVKDFLKLMEKLGFLKKELTIPHGTWDISFLDTGYAEQQALEAQIAADFSAGGGFRGGGNIMFPD
jgi:hypothetical protein